MATSNFPFQVTEHTIEGQHIREYPRATATEDAPLKLLIKKYTPLDNLNPQPGDITLIGFHGTGFPKELYEPLWEEILARSKQDEFRIRAIWMADSAHQNASGVYNEQNLGNSPSWLDHSRDVLHMINHFRDEMPRPLMGFGHSLGGVQAIFLSLMHPRLFTSLILTEPHITDEDKGQRKDLLLMTIKAKDKWNSRAEAAAKARKMLRIWDPRVLDRWEKYGLRDLPTAIYPESKTTNGEPAVTQTTTKHQTALMYYRENLKRHKHLGLPDEEDENETYGPSPAHDPLFVPDMLGPLYREQRHYRAEPLLAAQLLPYLRPSVFYLSAAKSELTLTGLQEWAAKRTGTGFGGSGGMQSGKVKHVVIEKAFHTLPLEKVAKTASEMGPWMAQESRRWKDDEKRIADGWEGLSVKEKSTLPHEWVNALVEASSAIEARAKRESKI
ncbi:toxin biosynthesis protein [Penicillium nucicola]|uniref:toxin biosynthesis protein n=1 Tax=Penicillium nucicola TaxID=1850975 RepID=UPI0025453E1A|nr:toxin biosynthesis protein [Penicillium nucicola]KAJ5748699.1 toxin biosynthesis protein [Penicillium nucicola]